MTEKETRAAAIHRAHFAPFGAGGFGQAAERFARFFGTPKFLIGQSVLIAIWIVINCVGVFTFDHYPFILLNLLFSTQAAYAAPLILLAQTRQADRDKLIAEADARHREEIADVTHKILDAIHDIVRDDTPGGLSAVDDKLDTVIRKLNNARDREAKRK